MNDIHKEFQHNMHDMQQIDKSHLQRKKFTVNPSRAFLLDRSPKPSSIALRSHRNIRNGAHSTQRSLDRAMINSLPPISEEPDNRVIKESKIMSREEFY